MKSPAFQFYADDFIGGTVMFTAEDVGAYMRLLCFQWGNGEIPERKDLVDRIAGCVVSDDVMAKFPDGKNARLEQVRMKQDEYRKMQSDKGKASAKARFNHGSTTVQPEHQPKGNSPISISISNSDLQTPPSSNHEDPPASAKPKGVVDGKESDLLPTSENAKRVAVMFHRRLTTAWSIKERDAFREIGKIEEDDLKLMEAFYKATIPKETDYRRHDLKTCLNNWQGEVDKARKWKFNLTAPTTQKVRLVGM